MTTPNPHEAEYLRWEQRPLTHEQVSNYIQARYGGFFGKEAPVPTRTGERAERAVIPLCAIFMPGVPHGGELGPIRAGCEHEHLEELQGCAEHRLLLPWMEKNLIRFLCPDCGHACRIMVTEGGHVYRFNLDQDVPQR